jgi:hypothetical protein
MKRPVSRPPSRPPRPAAASAPRAQAGRVFRDFLRQLERLDAQGPKSAREGSR